MSDDEPASSDDELAPLDEAMAALGDEGDELRAQWDKANVRAQLFGVEPPLRRIGRYVIAERLGAGGMGEVFAGHDPTLDRAVAIKLLHVDLHSDTEQSRARMIREAKTLARLSHPNVVQVYEVGESHGRVFIAMELLRGTTLGQWRQAERPGWRALLLRYLEAGRGLAAVHGAGLVHRDFKPDNVLVGADGRVCVADFGLARHASGSPSSVGGEGSMLATATRSSASASPPSDEVPPTRLTRTGRIAGTPAYMAPEQLRGEEVDALADQFAFCVALYEGLYGRRPFGGRTLAALVASHRAGPLVPSRRSAVPRRLWRVLAKGLAAAPEDRYASMEALLRALDPVRARRRRVLLMGVLLGPSALAAGVALVPKAGPSCVIDASALDGAWDDARREQVAAAFRRTKLPFAEDALHTTETTLDRWGTQWLDARAAACEATHVQGTQSQERLDARVACLERQRRALAARTQLLAQADAPLVGRSDRVLADLPDVAACAEPGGLDELYPRPSDPEVAAAIDDARDEIVRGGAYIETGELGRAEALFAALRERTEALEYPPLTLEAELLAGRLLIARDELDEGFTALQQVAWKAEALHLDDFVATVRARLARRSANEWSRPEQERWLLEEAEAAVARVGRPNDPRRLELELARGILLSGQGDHEAAITVLRRGAIQARKLDDEAMAGYLVNALANALQRRGEHDSAARELMTALGSAEARYGARSPMVADVSFDLGLLELERGHDDAAASHIELAASIFAEVFGPQSLDVARTRFAQVKLSMNRGDLDEARRRLDEVLKVYEHELGSEHVDVAQVLTARGTLSFFAAAHTSALHDWRRALAIVRRVRGPRHDEVGLLTSNIGESQLALRQPAAALESFDEALAIMQGALPPGHRLLALPSKGRGLALLALGRNDEAIPELERALGIHDAGSGEPIEHAETRFALARALAPREPTRAHALGEQALQDFENLALHERHEDVATWLAHASPPEQRGTP